LKLCQHLVPILHLGKFKHDESSVDCIQQGIVDVAVDVATSEDVFYGVVRRDYKSLKLDNNFASFYFGNEVSAICPSLELVWHAAGPVTDIFTVYDGFSIVTVPPLVLALYVSCWSQSSNKRRLANSWWAVDPDSSGFCSYGAWFRFELGSDLLLHTLYLKILHNG